MAKSAPVADKDARKANKRGAARLAAVQALYQMDIAGTGLNEILAEFEINWLGREVDGAQYLPAEAAFFRDVVSGVVREQRKLDPIIDEALAKSWPLKRIETVLRVNLSDLAAKGARPLGCLLSLALPKDIDDDLLTGFAEGVRGDALLFS